MAYQRGSLKKVRRKEGETWVLRYWVASADGGRVEHTTLIGLVQQFPEDKDARRDVDRLGILIRINDDHSPSRIRFKVLAKHYLKADFGADASRPKSENSTSIMEHIVRDYLMAIIESELPSPDVIVWIEQVHERVGHIAVTAAPATKFNRTSRWLWKIPRQLKCHVLRNAVQQSPGCQKS